MEMEYTITLKRMEFRAYHGCYDMEQVVGNRFYVELRVCTSLGGLLESDDVADAGVNYLTAYEIVRERMAIKRHTIEVVAADIIARLRESFPAIKAVECTVAKIAPPLGGKVESVCVTLNG